MPHIVILTHAHAPLDEGAYFIRDIADVWREQGHRVTVARGLSHLPPADLALLHIDLTRVPDDYLAAAADHYPRVLNLAARDISKRHVATGLVTPGDGYDGPVIVKTDANAGGWRDALVAGRASPLRRCLARARRRLPWTRRAQLGVLDYPVFDRAADVPAAVWRNPHLVVQRFAAERDGDLYGLRMWLFLGDGEASHAFYSPNPIVKSRNAVRKETLPGPPPELRDLRRRLGFDYGKFDYGLVDGRVVLYDANTTPTRPRNALDYFTPAIRAMASGLEAPAPPEPSSIALAPG